MRPEQGLGRILPVPAPSLNRTCLKLSVLLFPSGGRYLHQKRKKKRADQVEVLVKVKSKCLPPAQSNGTWTPAIYQTQTPTPTQNLLAARRRGRSRRVCADLPMLVNYVQQPPNRCSLASRPLASLASNESKVINVCDTATVTIQCYSYSYSCSYSIGSVVAVVVSIAGLCINKYAFIGRRLQLFAIKATFFLISISC